jgi:hypothetical protein
MKMSESLEYNSIEFPGLKLVSSKLSRLQVTDTHYYVLFHTAITAIEPSHIESTIFYRLKVSFEDKLGNYRTAYFSPSLSPDVVITGSTTRPDETISRPITSMLNLLNGFPYKAVDGKLYFDVVKLTGEQVLVSKLEFSIIPF